MVLRTATIDAAVAQAGPHARHRGCGSSHNMFLSHASCRRGSSHGLVLSHTSLPRRLPLLAAHRGGGAAPPRPHRALHRSVRHRDGAGLQVVGAGLLTAWLLQGCGWLELLFSCLCFRVFWACDLPPPCIQPAILQTSGRWAFGRWATAALQAAQRWSSLPAVQLWPTCCLLWWR